MPDTLRFFATCPRGIEPLLAAELAALGAGDLKEGRGGVYANATLEGAYRACLWTRLANRVLMPLAEFPADSADALYAAARKLDWPDLFAQDTTFAVEVAGQSPTLTHTHYAGLKVKDAIADTFRAKSGKRPDVDTDHPGLRVHLHLSRATATISLDLSGDSLHRRGYRAPGTPAPLKENLAAALLMHAGWPQLAAQGRPLLDPMCGSGTLVLEAALMAADVAPGLKRKRFGFEAWLDHKPKLWKDIRAEAQERARLGLARELPPMAGKDVDAGAIRAAADNARRAGLEGKVRFVQADVSAARPEDGEAGLVICNPPYGERLGAEADVVKLYSLLGATLKEHFGGWQAAVFTGRPDLGPRLGLRARKMHALYNGPLPCKLLLFDIAGEPVPAGRDAADDFANRLHKNLKHLGKWARRTGVNAYRLYDADLPDYAVAVDVYACGGGDELHVVVQEYAAPKTVDPARAERRLRGALAQVQQILDVPATRIHYRLRKTQRHRAGQQYEREKSRGAFHEVVEDGCRLRVNFDEYLDTGLFLDHRPLRRRIQAEAAGKRFLNLFCYTGSATVHAAKGGALQTVSVDLSNTYLEWAQQNLELNGFHASSFRRKPESSAVSRGKALDPDFRRGDGHHLFRADCLEWLREQAPLKAPSQFDLILLDPPTFSTSKRMEETLDVQRDHVELIRNAAALLAPGGTLYFSTNRRGFKLDTAALAAWSAEDITVQTLDEDFRRPPPPHRCWKLHRG
jgi:23S rRNA (guanine2445-N2)-methyltransferase / 23S rRNA (guanine2069-N7)-methyltransferase